LRVVVQFELNRLREWWDDYACLCDLLGIASLVKKFAIFVRNSVNSKCYDHVFCFLEGAKTIPSTTPTPEANET
jgi:hypothetical protein